MAKRRQNHSCEQCKKSKKACDGYLRNSGNVVSVEAELLDLGIQDGVFHAPPTAPSLPHIPSGVLTHI